jgi:phosphoglycerate dehydrogenase-like enzyme
MKIVTNNLSSENLDRIRQIAPHIDFVVTTEAEETLREIEDTDAFWGYGITPEFVRQASKLRWVQVNYVGIEALMFSELVNSDIILTNARGTTGINIAEHVMALILAFTRTLHLTIKRQMEKVWEIRPNLPVMEVAKRANAFDMLVLAIDPVLTEKPEYVEGLWEADQLHRMLQQSDFVVVCCPLTPQTKGIIGETEFRMMKETAFLINIARGKIVDQLALITALQTKEISGAGLDVTEPEPLPENNPLWEMENVIITPHHAGQSPKSASRVFHVLCENLKRFVTNQPLISVVDKTQWF